MQTKTDEIECFEAGSGEVPWVGCADFAADDRAALEQLARDRVIEYERKESEIHISGVDRVGIVALPSGRRLVIRSKIENLVLLDWLAYLGEFPPLDSWLPGNAVSQGSAFPVCLARLFLGELDKLTRQQIRKDYAAVFSHESTIRGRILTTRLWRNLDRLPRVPQSQRSRTVDVPHNLVLALALDRIPRLLPSESSEDHSLCARLCDQWSCVDRALIDPVSAVTEAQWACPPGYRVALQLARLILLGATLDSRAAVSSLMFTLPLAAIWERGLQKMLVEIYHETGWSPNSNRTRHWHDKAHGSDTDRLLIADVVMERGGERWILDAKYKRDFGTENRNDRFQMCAYAVAFDADVVSLVYPVASKLKRRVLLDSVYGQKRITIDSLSLPMAQGPDACKAALIAYCRS